MTDGNLFRTYLIRPAYYAPLLCAPTDAVVAAVAIVDFTVFIGGDGTVRGYIRTLPPLTDGGFDAQLQHEFTSDNPSADCRKTGRSSVVTVL